MDGKYSSVAGESQFCSETLEQDSPWWTVELDIETTIHRVVIKTDRQKVNLTFITITKDDSLLAYRCAS